MRNGTFQHYIPRFLLREFGRGKKGKERICVYDKLTGRVFQTKISEIGAEYGFYDIQGVSLDEHLKEIETSASREIHRIVKRHSLRGTDRPLVSLFMVIQELRTESFRSKIRRINVELADHLLAMGATPREVRQQLVRGEEGVKFASLDMIARAEPFVEALLHLDWFLFEVPNGHHLFISDAPVVRQNLKHHGELFSMGLVSDGIEVYLPLSEHLVLGLLCPSYRERMLTTLHGPQPRNTIAESISIGLIKQGLVFPLNADNIENLNSLQIYQSRRFIFSAHDGFQLAKRMAEHEPSLKDAMTTDERFKELLGTVNSNPRKGTRGRRILTIRRGVPSIWRSIIKVVDLNKGL